MAVSTSCGTASRPIMSPPVRLSKLPPISSCHEGDEAPSTHPSKLLLESATSELKDTMKHLLSEAQSAEDRLQQAIDSLWQRMMEMIEKRTQDYDIQLSKTSDELKIVKGQLAKTTEQEAALVQQNAKMSVELVAGDKKQKLLESDLQSAKDQLKKREAEICKLREETRKLQTRHDGVAENLGKELEEKNKTLKDYQDKITKMTDKLQKLTRNLTEEKAATEKLQKANGSQIAQQTSDNRKMALEISKLKLQVTTTSTALAASKEEVKQLEMQLKKANTESEATVCALQKQHALAVKSLEDKITALQLEIDELKAKHEAEIALLKEQLEKLAAEGDDGFLDARIRFLQHQNRQEKIKIHKEKKKQS